MIKKLDNLIRQNNLEKYLTKKYFNYFIIGFFGLLGLYLNWDANMMVAGLALVWLLLFPLKSQVLAKLAILFLAMTLIMLTLNRNGRAEIFSELAFLLLIISVITACFFERDRLEKE
jgi:hypothetical protein